MSDQNFQDQAFSGRALNAPNPHDGVVVTEDKQDNSVVRFLFENHGVRGEIMHMHEPAQRLLEHIQHYPNCIKGLLLDLAAAAVLIATTLKANGTVTVQLQCGKGPNAINFAFVNIDKHLNFYGNASWEQKSNFKEVGFSELVGQDAILVISAFPEGGNRYQGIVSLNGADSLDQALQDYFRDSEQLPTAMFFYHDVVREQAGGILLQIIPNIENNGASLEHLSILASSMTNEEIFSESLHTCLHRLYWNDQVRVFEPEKVAFKCICSRERIANALRGLGLIDLEDLAQEKEGTDMTCNSCGKVYHLTQEEIQEILKEAKAEAAKENTLGAAAAKTAAQTQAQIAAEQKAKARAEKEALIAKRAQKQAEQHKK